MPVFVATIFAPPRRDVRRARRGFTLIELVLVMLVLCIIMAMAVPQLRGFMSSSAARDTATQVVAMAHYARAKAASDAVVYRLSIDEANGKYSLSKDAADGTGNFTDLGTDFSQVFELPTGMKVTVERLNSAVPTRSSASNGEIDFRPDGTSDPVVIHLTDAKGNETLIAAPAPTEPFRITTAQEVNDS
jgi:prepilin-type N-terminal cleavage/methylation domain-containing protein